MRGHVLPDSLVGDGELALPGRTHPGEQVELRPPPPPDGLVGLPPLGRPARRTRGHPPLQQPRQPARDGHQPPRGLHRPLHRHAGRHAPGGLALQRRPLGEDGSRPEIPLRLSAHGGGADGLAAGPPADSFAPARQRLRPQHPQLQPLRTLPAGTGRQRPPALVACGTDGLRETLASPHRPGPGHDRARPALEPHPAVQHPAAARGAQSLHPGRHPLRGRASRRLVHLQQKLLLGDGQQCVQPQRLAPLRLRAGRSRHRTGRPHLVLQGAGDGRASSTATAGTGWAWP